MLLKLPHELREAILKYVKHKDLRNLTFISRNYNAELKEFLFKTVHICCSDLQKTDLANDDDGHLHNLKYTKCLHLSSHHFSRQPLGDMPSVALILNNCNPCHLSITANLLTQEIYVQISKLSNLRELSIVPRRPNGNVIDEYVRIICDGLTRLTSLKIQDCTQLTNKSLQYIGNLLHLEDIDLADLSNVDDIGFSPISKLRHLKKVNFRFFSYYVIRPKVSGNALVHLAGLAKIKVLGIGGWVNLNDAGMSILGRVTSLKTLKLGICRTITDEGVSYLKDLTQLEYYDLSWCCNITGDCFSFVNWNLLKELHLRACVNLTDQGLSYVQNFHQLEKLNIEDCMKISDVSLDHIRKLHKLRHLNISHCRNITDSGICALRGLLSMEVLNVSYCDKITDKAMKYIGSMKKLIRLSVEGNLNVSNHGLSYLQSLVLLKNLTLLGCEQISDSGLHYLSKLGNLKILNMFECSVTSKGVEDLRKQLLSVKHIQFDDK